MISGLATICSFSCKPNSGSEWGVGWNYLELVSIEFERVLLITRDAEDQRNLISQGFVEKQINNVEVIYIEDVKLLFWLRRKAWFKYYIVLQYFIWQFVVVKKIKELNIQPKLLMHVTWVSDWLPSFVHYFISAEKKIYGPVGSQNFNFARRISHSFNIRYFIKKLIRYNIINYINAVNTDACLGISGRFVEKFPWCKSQNPYVLLPVHSEMQKYEVLLNNRFELVFIGKNLDFKNFDYFEKLADRALSLSLVSKISVFGDFDKRCRDRNSNFTFHGVVAMDELSKYLQSHRCILFQSSCEAGGTVGVECLSIGVPVVCFQKHGLSEFLPDYPLQIEVAADWVDGAVKVLEYVRADYGQLQREMLRLYHENLSIQKTKSRFHEILQKIYESSD